MPELGPFVPRDVLRVWDMLCTQDEVTAGPLRGDNAYFYGNPVVSSWYRDLPNMPNVGVYTYDEYVLVLCAGLKSAGMGLEFHADWSRKSYMLGSQGFMRSVYRWANYIMDHELRQRLRANMHVVLVGHSGGGPTMECLAYLVKQYVRFVTLTVITGGSPRSILYGRQYNIPLADRYRFMYVGDPVTYLPPHSDESPSSWSVEAITQGALFRDVPLSRLFSDLPDVSPVVWDQVVHTPGGIILTPQGNSWYANDQGAPPNALGNIVSWLYPGDRRHSKMWQLNAMRLWARRFEATAGAGGGGDSGGAWGQEVEPEITAPGQFLFGVTGHLLRDAPAYILPIPPNGVIAPMATNEIQTSSKPAVGGGREYTLSLMGLPIATYDTRGRANTAGRHLRGFLKRLGNANQVDQQGIVDALMTYLVAAGAGQGIDNRPVSVV